MIISIINLNYILFIFCFFIIKSTFINIRYNLKK